MKNPLHSSELSNLRNKRQRADWGVAIHKPLTVYTGVSTDLVSHYPTSSVSLASISGLSALVQEDFMAFVGSSAGASDKGRVRVRGFDGTTMKIAEAGSGLINFDGTFYITVKEWIEPTVKHPRYDTAASKWAMDYDNIIQGDYLTRNYRPYINMGAPVVGFLENGSFTASFVNSDSLFLDVPHSTHAWYFPDGQSFGASELYTEDNPLVVTFTDEWRDGRYFRCEVVDVQGGSWVSYRPIWIYSDISQVPKATATQITGGINDGGFTANFSTFTNELIPEGTEVVIFERARYGDNYLSIGGNAPHRNNIVFRGWLTRDTTTVNAFTGRTDWEAASLHSALGAIESYDMFVQNVEEATDWDEAKNLSLDRMAMMALQWRSTISKITDFYPASGLAMSEKILYQELPRGSFWDQLRVNYGEKGYLGYFSSDMQGSLWAFEDTDVTGASNTTAHVANFTETDFMEGISWRNEHRNRGAQVKLFAFSSDVWYGAAAPGGVMGYGGFAEETSTGLITDSQQTLTEWAGNLLAKRNKKYFGSLPMAGNFRIDPVPLSKMGYTGSLDTRTGTQFDEKMFNIMGISISNDSINGVTLSTLEVEEIVDGLNGSAITIPSISDVVVPPTVTPTDTPGLPETPTNSPSDGLGTVFVMTQDGISSTESFRASPPTWTRQYTPYAGGSMFDFILDPWNPRTKAFSTDSSGVLYHELSGGTIVSTSRIYDYAVHPPLPLYRSGNEVENNYALKIVGSINKEGYLVFGYMRLDDEGRSYIQCTYTYDHGGSWNHSVPIGKGAIYESTHCWDGMLDIAPHLVNGSINLWVAANHGGGHSNRELFIRKSLDGGSTWTGSQAHQVGTGTQTAQMTPHLHVPYADNEDAQTVILHSQLGGGNSTHVSTDGGSTFSHVQILGNGAKMPYIKRAGAEIYTGDASNVFVWANNSDATCSYVLKSDDGIFGTFDQAGMAGFSGLAYGAGGFPYNNSLFYAIGNQGIFVSEDGGDNWEDKTGNCDLDFTSGYSGSTANGLPFNNAKSQVIVPVWVE